MVLSLQCKSTVYQLQSILSEQNTIFLYFPNIKDDILDILSVNFVIPLERFLKGDGIVIVVHQKCINFTLFWVKTDPCNPLWCLNWVINCSTQHKSID